MMLRLPRITAAFCILLGLASPGAANPVFERQLDEIIVNLKSVWRAELRQAVNLTPGYQGTIDGLTLEIVTGCEWVPRAKTDTRTVYFGRRLLALSQYLQQAWLLYLTGNDLVAQPEKVVEYLENRLVPIADLERERCDNPFNKADKDNVEPIPSILEGRVSNQEYALILSKLKTSPLGPTADYLAGAPIFFSLLHEAGHIVQSSQNLDPDEVEASADQFAASVFRVNKLPSTLGIGNLQLLEPLDSSGAIACRLGDIVRSDTRITDQLTEIPLSIRQRLDSLNRYLAVRYQEKCIR